MPEKVLITGSGGLIGSAATRYFSQFSTVIGVENTPKNQQDLQQLPGYTYRCGDVRYFDSLEQIIEHEKPEIVIHCAAQPSEDQSGKTPYSDFLTNTLGTVNLLESVRYHIPRSIFIFLSSSKVYGENPNTLSRIELPTRFELDQTGVDETLPIDQTLHSPFGASKAAADLMVQEYGKYYGMKTVCFRCNCIVGSSHDQHGFLNHLYKTIQSGDVYTICGHQGKQIRDHLHPMDLAKAFHEFCDNPRCGEVYNLGGGYENTCSVLEAIERIGGNPKLRMGPERRGDLVCYYSDNSKFCQHYPKWKITRDLDFIFDHLGL